MRFSILGPLAVHDDRGRPVPIGGARLRVLLSLLLLRTGRRLDPRDLSEAIWPDRAPAQSANALQALVSRLRRALGEGASIDGNGAGYLLRVDPDEVDLHQFESLADRGRERLTAGHPEEAEQILRRARALWRGPVLPDLTALGLAEETALRLVERQRAVVEDHLAAQLSLGRHGDVLPEAEALAGSDPYRERPVEILVRALAGTGRAADALEAYDTLRARLAEDLGMDPSPNMQDLHLSLLRNELAAPVPGPSRRTVSLRVPTVLTSFVPREEELDTTMDLLSTERLVTLTGPGGAGKTRLAIEVAGALADRAPELVVDGGWFVELAPLRIGADVPKALVSALDLRENAMFHARSTASPASASERVASFLEERAALLVIDNCEHVIDDVARVVASLLARCPHLRVMATSREPLGVPGERLMPIPPLGLPAQGSGAQEASGHLSVALFTERARAVRPDFTVTPDNVEHVVRIVRALDGAPLALELAAARLRSMTPAQLAGRLGDRFRLLTGTGRTVLPRHRTLRAVVDWSWELLDTAERRLLRRLSVFPGGATLEAIERVGVDPDLDGDDGRDVWTILFALVDKSLVVAENAEDDLGPPRYRLLETVRAYAEEQLVAAGEATRVRDAHARYVRDLWREADPCIRGSRQHEWLTRLGAEADNFGAAVRRAVEAGDAHLALDLIEYGQWYWILDGDWELISRWGGEVLFAFGDRIPRGRAIAHACCLFHRVVAGGEERGAILRRFLEIEELLAAEGERPEDHHVLVHGVLYAALSEGDLGPRHQRLRARVDHPDPWMRAMLCALVAMVENVRGRARLSLEYAEDSLAGFRALGDVWGRCQASAQVTDVHRFDDVERTWALLEEGVRLAEGHGLSGLALSFRLRRAQTQLDLGELSAAEEDLEVLEAEGLPAQAEPRTLHRMVRIQLLRERGETDEAVAQIVEAQEEVVSLGGFAPVYLEPGWWALAATVYHRAGDTENAHRSVGRSWWLGRFSLGPIGAEVLDVMALLAVEEDPRRATILLGYAEALRGLADGVTRHVVWARETAHRALGEEYVSLLARTRKVDPRQVREIVDEWWADHRPTHELDLPEPSP